MSATVFLLAIPLLGATAAASFGSLWVSVRINIVASLLGFLVAIWLVASGPEPSQYFLLDGLNAVFIVLTALIGFTTSLFSATYVGHELATGRLTASALRVYHALFQVMVFAMFLALVADNIGLVWVAVEIATLTAVMAVGLYRTNAGLEAAWKYFILGSVGIALALFGTILVYLASVSVLGDGVGAMAWTNLTAHAATLDPALLNVAFVFLLLGYGTKMGLVPMHAWLADAHAEGPTPIAAVLSGLLLNVALYTVLRFKRILAGNAGTLAAGPLLVILGLVSLLFGALMLYRRRDIKRLFAFSSIEHIGLMAVAFGIGGPLGNFAGLLQMAMHGLTKSAIYFTVGRIAQLAGTQRMSDIRGLTSAQPALGWTLVVGVVAIGGLPPSGLFASEFLLITTAFAQSPLLAGAIALGVLLALAALLRQLAPMAFGAPGPAPDFVAKLSVPAFAHLALVLVTGLYLPSAAVGWLNRAAALLP